MMFDWLELVERRKRKEDGRKVRVVVALVVMGAGCGENVAKAKMDGDMLL